MDILTNPDIVTLKKKGNILGRNPLPILLFTYDSLKIKFVPLLKSCKPQFRAKKTILEVGNKTANEKKGKGKKETVSRHLYAKF